MLEIGTYEKNYRGLNLEDGNFSLLQLSFGNFKSADDISNKFDWLSILRDTRLFFRTGCNASLTNQIR